MAHFKGHKLTVAEVDGAKEIRFEDALDVNDLKKELKTLGDRRKALGAKVAMLEKAMKDIAAEEAELTDILKDVGEA